MSLVQSLQVLLNSKEDQKPKIEVLLKELLEEVKNRRKTQILCKEGIVDLLVKNYNEFVKQGFEGDIQSIIYSILKRPTLGDYFNEEISQYIMKSNMWLNNIDIIRCLTRTQTQATAMKPYINLFFETFKKQNVVETIECCYVVTNFSRVAANELVDIGVKIVDDLIVYLSGEWKQENVVSAGEALIEIIKNVSDKTMLEQQIQDKVVKLKEEFSKTPVLNSVLLDISQTLIKK
ncbi:Uncharacterized protein QTN25_001406 [Entamoeba marina]